MDSLCLHEPGIDAETGGGVDPSPLDGALPVYLPEWCVTPTRMSVFMFSAITWNRHHIHYDKDAALAEGLGDVAVQRALIGNYFARSLSGCFGGRGRLHRLSWRMHKSAYPGRELRCRGVVVARSAQEPLQGEELQCELEMLDDNGDTVSTATALLCITDIC